MQKKGEFRIIGKSWPRPDVLDKVRGRPIYAIDHDMPGMLYGKVVRSLYPSARILAIDTSEAERLPGVVCVLTHRDVPHNRLKMALPARMADPTRGAREAFRPVLAGDRVRFYGEAIALVAAETPEAAEEAARLVRVEYEELPGVYDPLEALKPDAPRVHEEGNIAQTWRIRKGNPSQAMEEAEVVLERTFRVQLQDHAFLEPESGLAWIDPDGTLVILVGTQVIEHYREVAEVLQIPQNKVRLIGVPMGGGFGGREDLTVEVYLGLLAWRTRRPVKMAFTRQESFLSHGKRNAYVLKYKVGAKRTGELVALEADIVAECGAYAELSPWILHYTTVGATGPYRIPNVRVDASLVYTNNGWASAFRGFGSMQACFAYEGMMDELAQALGMDPLELRKKNFLHKGEPIGTGWPLPTEPMLETLAQKALEALGPPPQPVPGKRFGRGIAAGMIPYGRMAWARDSAAASVGMELDGTAVVRCAVPEIGGGQKAVLVAITAEVLGLPLEAVSIAPADSHLAPRGGTATATRQLYMAGNAVYHAALQVRESLVAQAAEMLGTTPDRVELRDGHAVAPDGRSIPMARLVQAATASGRAVYSLYKFDAPYAEIIDPETGQGQPFNDFTFGVHAAEVEVDEETGQVTLRKYATCYDVGRAINRNSVEGQLQGGAAMGIGDALMEDLVFENGVLLNPTFMDYKVPTTLDLPDITPVVVESGQGLGPFGAKGVGEPALIPARAAVVNAVSNAIGVRLRDAPLTPERVYRAMHHQGGEG